MLANRGKIGMKAYVIHKSCCQIYILKTFPFLLATSFPLLAPTQPIPPISLQNLRYSSGRLGRFVVDYYDFMSHFLAATATSIRE